MNRSSQLTCSAATVMKVSNLTPVTAQGPSILRSQSQIRGVHMNPTIDDLRAELILTPGLILKRLISTILSSLPQITISHVAMLPLNRFQEVNDSGLKAWELLAERKYTLTIIGTNRHMKRC